MQAVDLTEGITELSYVAICPSRDSQTGVRVMWALLFFNVVVRDDERAFLTRDGRFVRMLEPGRYREFDPSHKLKAEVVKVTQAEVPVEKALLFEKAHSEVAAEHFTIVQPIAHEVAIVSMDGAPKHLVLPHTTRAFWKTLTSIEVETIDTSADLRVSKEHLAKLDVERTRVVIHDVVASHETGLLFVDGDFVEQLKPGMHAFWEIGRKVKIVKVDMRPTPLEVTAQEILTKDRVGIRVTLTAFYKVIDALKATTGSADVANTLYRLVQFAIREAVATRTLDEILGARDTIDQEVRNYVTARVGDLGVEINEIGVKDVILPGDVRDLLNHVVEAERMAKANLIKRQEETAATRSLLNTARLMDDNPLLLRLKELEALEKLVEKVGRIDLHTGGGAAGLEALLKNLYRMTDKTEGETA